MKRPSLLFFLYGLSAAVAIEYSIPLIIYLLINIIIIFIVYKLLKCNYVILIILFIFSIFILFRTYSIQNPSINIIEEEQIIKGEVVSIPINNEDNTKAIISTDSFGSTEKIQLVVSNNYHKKDIISYGDIVEVSGNILKPKGQRNPGGFNYNRYLKSKNIHTIIYTNTYNIRVLDNIYKPVISDLINLRYKIIGFIDENFPKEISDFIKGIMLGDKGIDEDTKNKFSQIGISHILAVSGLHVGYIFIFIKWLIKLFRLSKVQGFILMSVILFCYCTMVGFSLSVLRASIMLWFISLASILKKKYDTISILSIIATIFIINNPYIIFTISFQLSFSAVFFITLLYPPLNNKYKFSNKIIDSIKSIFLISFIVQLGTIPIISYNYYQISPLSILINMYVVPMVGVIIVIASIALFLNIFSNILLNFLFWILEPMVKSILLLVDYSSSLSINFIIGSMPIHILILYFTILLSIFGYTYLSIERNKVITYLIISLCIAISVFEFLYPNSLTVTFLDIGQGDSILIETPYNDVILIDGGSSKGNFTSGKDIILPALYSKGISRIDLMVCTHSHEDHMGGLIEIIDDIEVGAVMINSLEEDNYKQIKRIATINSIPVIEANNGTRINFTDDLRINILYPFENMDIIPEENNCSLVSKLSYKNVSFIFTGDLEKLGEDFLIKNNVNIRGQVLKIGHHGSATSTQEKFLMKIDPLLVIISVGENNQFGHPEDSVLEVIDNNNIPYYRTDSNGAIEIKTKGEIIKVKSYLR